MSQILKITAVKFCMTTNVETVQSNELMTKVKEKFDCNTFHHLPVKDEADNLVGMISYSDLLLMLDWGTKHDLPNSMRRNDALLSCMVASDVMTANILTVDCDDMAYKCYTIFRENRFHALPVLDKNKKLVGIISPIDLLTYLCQNN